MHVCFHVCSVLSCFVWIICMYIVCIYMYVFMYMYICMCVYICMIYVNVYLYICIYMYVHLCTYMLLSVYVFVHAFVCVKVCLVDISVATSWFSIAILVFWYTLAFSFEILNLNTTTCTKSSTQVIKINPGNMNSLFPAFLWIVYFQPVIVNNYWLYIFIYINKFWLIDWLTDWL